MGSDSLLTHIARQLNGQRLLLVAFSGGLDSTVLLQALVALRNSHLPDLKLRAIYIHHGLSANADAWSEHCHYWCERWQVPVQTIRVQLSMQGMGIEAAARKARYQVLSEQLQPREVLLTAQHLDDQCETLLLALKRGSGPAGLAGMAPGMPFAKGVLLRPLLAISREQLVEYAAEHGLRWVEDESNQDPSYDRNFIRLQVIPSLVQRWPHFAQAVARSAALCGEQEQLLDQLLSERLATLMESDGSLSISGLLPLSEVKRNALLRRWISAAGGSMPSRDHLSHLWRQVALSQQDAKPCLQFGCWQVRRFRQRLYLLPLFPSLQDVVLGWDGVTPLQLPDRLGWLQLAAGGIPLRAPKVGERVTIRFVAHGEVKIVGRAHSRAIKKLWQELNIPPWQRQRIPLLYFDQQLIAALGVFLTEEGRSIEGQPIWWVQWVKEQRE